MFLAILLNFDGCYVASPKSAGFVMKIIGLGQPQLGLVESVPNLMRHKYAIRLTLLDQAKN